MALSALLLLNVFFCLSTATLTYIPLKAEKSTCLVTFIPLKYKVGICSHLLINHYGYINKYNLIFGRRNGV